MERQLVSRVKFGAKTHAAGVLKDKYNYELDQQQKSEDLEEIFENNIVTENIFRPFFMMHNVTSFTLDVINQ